MKMIIGTLFFALVVFPHFIELSSPTRTREQTELRETEEASSSGRHHTEGSVRAYGRLIPHNKFTGPIPGSGLPKGKYQSLGIIPGLYHKVDNHYILFTKDFNAASKGGIVYGAVIDGYVRPLYDHKGRQIIVSEETHKKTVISEDKVAKLGFHQHISEHFAHLPSIHSAQGEKH